MLNNKLGNALITGGATLTGGFALRVGYEMVMLYPLETMYLIDTVYGVISPEPPLTIPQLIGNRVRSWIIDPILGN